MSHGRGAAGSWQRGRLAAPQELGAAIGEDFVLTSMISSFKESRKHTTQRENRMRRRKEQEEKVEAEQEEV